MYGVVGLGHSFGSSLNQYVIKGGFSTHPLRTKRFKINTEISITYLTRLIFEIEGNKKSEEKWKDFDYKKSFSSIN